jgi:SPP1 gp7 family putative phage head morphogenesis protein
MCDLAGQLMVRGREAKLIKLDVKDAPYAFLDLPWDEALQAFMERVPTRANELQKLLKGYATRSDAARRLALEQIQQFVKDRLAVHIADGGTYGQFAQDIQSGAESFGITAEDPSYVKMLFRTNIQSAYGAGKFRAITDPDVIDEMPYVQYRTVGDARVRASHAVLDRGIYRAASEEWRRIAPPNGFSCRCSLVSLSRDDVKGERVLGQVPAAYVATPEFNAPPVAAIKASATRRVDAPADPIEVKPGWQETPPSNDTRQLSIYELFNPSQARTSDGKWTKGGGGVAKKAPAKVAKPAAKKPAAKKEAPAKTGAASAADAAKKLADKAAGYKARAQKAAATRAANKAKKAGESTKPVAKAAPGNKNSPPGKRREQQQAADRQRATPEQQAANERLKQKLEAYRTKQKQAEERPNRGKASSNSKLDEARKKVRAQADAARKRKPEPPKPTSPNHITAEQWQQSGKDRYFVNGPNETLGVLKKNGDAIIWDAAGKPHNAKNPIWEVHVGNTVTQLHGEDEKLAKGQALRKATDVVNKHIDLAIEKKAKDDLRYANASKPPITREHLGQFAHRGAMSTLASESVDRGVLQGALSGLIGHAYAGIHRQEFHDHSISIRPVPKNTGSVAEHSWEGGVTIEREYAAAADRGLKRMAAGHPVDIDEADAIRLLVHEELHGHGPITPFHYVYGGRIPEEVTTEVLARKVARSLPTREPIAKHLMPRVSGEDALAGSYTPEITKVLQHLREATGITEDHRLHEILENGAASYKKLKPGTYASLIEALASSMPIEPAQRYKFWRLMERYAEEDAKHARA